jgi:D-amino-acid dehydrogenase
MSEKRIVVVGAGIVGASVALCLQREGHRVTLVDRDEPCAGASFGNAGGIVNGSCAPNALPGAVLNTIRTIGRSASPVSIQPAYFHRIFPWLLRFALESRRSSVTRNAQDLYALTRRAVSGWRQLTDNTELARLLRAEGWLKVYESDDSFSATSSARALMDDNGTAYEILTAHHIQDLEPHLAPIYQHGIFQEDSLSVINPYRTVQGMVELFTSHGGEFKQFELQGISAADEGITLSGLTGRLRADKVVIAAGAWSRPFARQLGDVVPLDTERGYHLMLSVEDSELLTRPVVNGDHSFVLCPMQTGLRLTAQVEFAGLSADPDYRKIRRLLTAARRMLPGIESEEQSAWMGFRPSLPDSLPVLGFSSNRNVLYAFGHQHLGMTLGPISGLIIADLVAGRDPGIDMTPYRADRF